MKKIRLPHRIIAMVLVILMTVQLLPLSAFAAFGDLQSWDPGVDLSTLKLDDAINWPIKVYDYLSDGMLFEWMDTNTTTSSSSPNVPVGSTDGSSYMAPYGGGEFPVVTTLGSDFTYDGKESGWTTNTYKNSKDSDGNYYRNYSSYYYYSNSSYGYGKSYTMTKQAAVDYSSPMYLRVTDGSVDAWNWPAAYFSTDQSNNGNARYMVLVYRASGVSGNGFGICLSNDTGGSSFFDRRFTTLDDSSEWTYKIIDLKSLFSTTYTTIQHVWFNFLTASTTGTYSDAKSKVGLKSGAYVDFTHIGFFADTAAANNYGEAALKFIAKPGEYLAHTAETTLTRYNVTPANRSDYLNNIFTLNYRWKTEGVDPHMFDSTSNAANVRYGLDFTTHSTANGWKTNAYTSDTFWTWSNGTNVSLKNTINNVTRKESFSMSKINVEQKTQSNGAQYVTLTTAGPSKILLSKFREDHQLSQEGYVPFTKDVNYMVLVYRPNGLTSSDKYALWAHGYPEYATPDSHKTSNVWKYAGLTKAADWTTADNVNPISFSDTSGWQYVVIDISQTIQEKDSDMSYLSAKDTTDDTQQGRLANLGLYLPTMTDGKSLDIAYVSYFKSSQFDAAHTFGASAVNYMKSSATRTKDSITGTTKSYADTRKWYGGGNKGFGMLYSSGGGQYWPGGNSGGTSTSTSEYEYGYKFDTWMIGYRTNAGSENSYNAARKDPITGDAYTAKYTPTGTGSGHSRSKLQADATGTTNNIYFIAATEEDATWGSNDGDDTNGKDFATDSLAFDGYQLLENITSGVMTAGLLEGGLQTVTVNGVNYRVPVYRQETVEYIAYNLLYGLRVPQRDSSGNYNTRYIKGTESTKFGGVDLNGDGVIGKIDYDGDSRNGNELDENSVDLATALRHELGLSARLTNSVNVMTTSSGGVDTSYATFYKQMGSYSDTVAKSRMLFGEFKDCRNAIDTAMDAAYYLLNNIFISESYNQQQDDYDYLTLSSATVNALGHSGYAYVFDAGFTTGKTADYGTTFTDNGTNQSAISYSPYGSEGGTGTISMEGVTGKTRFDYGTSTISWTTRFPFLPITDAEGDFAGRTKSYYFLDDAQRIYTEGSNSYKDRNFNYVIASNGEFVYREEDDLFFEFEGDDDVYLFINGQLVLDIGAAHSITSVYIDVNDYVNAAATALKGLEQYGYHKDMPIEQFDAWISAANIQKLDAEFNPTGETVANPFTADQIAEYKRQHRLNLSDGQICQFDFYYMERHGWGANMRIVTNMHITDPSLDVDKTAYQYGEEIEYGGVIDPTSSVEYSFKLTNTGNTKLYNLNWRDDVLGITMDPTNGLQVNEDMNGIYVMNSSGGYLQAKDLVARVTGTDIDGNETDFLVTFDEVDGDGGQESLKKFLKKLESDDGTQSGYDDAEVTNAGSGLWVGGSVQFRGMYYMLTTQQTKDGVVDNTVYLTATTRVDPATVGNRTLRSDDSHRLYTNGFPIHYQWAGHEIFMNLEHLLEQAKIEAARSGSQLSQYQTFFQNVTLDTLITKPCDKFGRVGGDYSDFLTEYNKDSNYRGYYINYENPGVYTFYLLMYMKTGLDDEGNSTNFASGGPYNASDIGGGYYAVLRSQVFVADVEDSVYVLDYGLSTESLDANGQLFKNDYLFGPYGTIRAKLMGITGGEGVDEPSFRHPMQQADPTKTGITFTALDSNRVYTKDGFYNANLAIPEGGKDIAYDSNKGEYTLTGVGTTTIKAVLPTVPAGQTDPWATPYLYYWYDDGTTGPAWPGTPMKKMGAGNFQVDIPADVANIIINNGSAALKTNDLTITPGLESTITVTVSDNNVVSTHINTVMQNVTMHVKVPADWGDVYLHHWHDDGQSTEFPGDQLTAVDEDGYYTIELHGDVANLLIANGAGKQTGDLSVFAGKEAWIEVSDTVTGTATDENGNVTTTYYGASVKYTLTEGFEVHASVPVGWGETVYLYYWRNDGSENAVWPGEAMSKGELWYTYDKMVPADVSHIIINDGTHQTVNLTVTPGLETWIMVNNEIVGEGEGKGKYTANIAYGSESSSAGVTFTPTDFLDEANEMWMAITVHGTNADPTALNGNIDIHNEVQMYKKITVLPATVVYYEDTFGALEYTKVDDNSDYTFTYHGNGSGQLSQSIDQDQPYGQDSTYQGAENDLYSGDSLTEITFKDVTFADAGVDKDTFMKKDFLVTTFDFKGTGFELISRTTAFDNGSFMARVYKKDSYTTDAYQEYMDDARDYLDKLTKFNNVYTTCSEADTLWEEAVAKYEEAKTAYSSAKTAYDAAVANTTDELYQTYLTEFNKAYEAFEAYEKVRSSYATALTDYQTALQAYKASENGYAVCVEKGGCSFTYSEELEDFETALVLGNKPTAPVVPGTLVTMTAPTMPESPFVTIGMVYTQFDHGNNGGAESLNQVPAIRVKGLTLGEYVVEVANLPTYTFNDSYEVIGVEPTSLYIDGLRIYQPMGATNDAYSDKENNATVEELRDLISNGTVGTGKVDADGLNVSTGNITWTESLKDNDFDGGSDETYSSVIVDTTGDYLIQGPNNEVYMEGTATNSALIFYVKETSAEVHELQISVRALDYGRYYGAGSTALNAQLQYGVLNGSDFVWKNLVQVVSGTEQYYTIPYAECPVDTQGRYQIILRAINPQTQTCAMVSYTNLKYNGLSIEKVDGLGETSLVKYENGILIKPEYELVIDGEAEPIAFNGTELSMTLERDVTSVSIRVTYGGGKYNYYATSDLGTVTSATLYELDDEAEKWTLNVPKGEVTFKIKQTAIESLELSYCLHTFGEGVVTREPNCSITGITAYTCSKCGHVKREHIDTNDDHHYSGGICTYCGAQEPKFYLVGYINNKDYGCGADANNMGEYLFVDGQLTVTFDQDSYVYLKADGNKAWYMLPTYITADTATFHDTTTSGNTEKMYVPCGIELIFTLTVNDDGSLTLHYEEPCKHNWDDGVVSVAATCTTDGEKTYTCSLCFQTKTGLIPATGHNYVDGVCGNTNCGEIEYRTIYFKNTAGWENVYMYAWVKDTSNTYTAAFPGDQMTLVEGYTDVYTATLPSYLMVLFNDGNNTQTSDLTIPPYADTYNYETGLWENLSGEVDYYLVGSINGVDYGYGENVNNMGAYKFEDGKLTATFDKDSYVIVKTTGNAKWYMAQTYCDTYSATLYDSTTGASEKMYMPAGTEIDFTLTVNEDGTLSLVAHSWGGVVTKEPTCTETGEKTYTCYLCNDSYKETVAANGHSFVDDVCSVCGAIDQRIVYFKNTAGWEKVYIYAFTEGVDEYTGAWPGVEMSLVEGETDLYYYEISAKAKSVIFNNGSGGTGNQTQNLHAPTGENNKYTYGANVWTTVDTEVEVPEGTKLYLDPDGWAVDDAWFAAYFFGNGDTWVKMTDTDGDGIYECYAPDGFTNVIFCRMNAANSALGWDAKWNQTVDETIPSDGKNFFTITNPWNGSGDKATGTWDTYSCDHTYTEEISTAAGCETVGEKIFACSKCGDRYTEEIPAAGHKYVKGSCSVCGAKDPDYVAKVYLLPGNDWNSSDAWFAAWFMNDQGGTWVTMTDISGNGYFQCEIPTGYTGVVFVRMSNEATEPNWDQKWNQTVDLIVEADRVYVIENPWSGSGDKATGSWTDYDSNVAECDHSYTEEITTAATCTTAGLMTATCDFCGDSYTEEIAATGHDYVENVIKAVSCSTSGKSEFTCSVCSDTYTETYEPTGHIFENGYCTGGCGTSNETQVVYLKPGTEWPSDEAWFVAEFEEDELSYVVEMTDVDGDGYYVCEVPAGAKWVTFHQMPAVVTTPILGYADHSTNMLDLQAGRVYVIETAGDDSFDATGYWINYEPECDHNYTEAVTTAATCTTAGVKTFTCLGCNNSYTEEIPATGHNYVDGTCTNCNEAEPVVETILYLVPGSDWSSDSAWFAAYFFGNGDTWVKMTDDDGDGTYQCVQPAGYPNVIFCRMNNEKTDLGWDSKWNQTADLTLPTDGGNMFTITGPWDGDGNGATGTWSTYGATETECDHSYTEAVTTAATCTTAGVKTFTCSKCSDSYTEEIAATGHNYVSGTCTNCNEAEPVETRTIYFRNTDGWSTVYIWAWDYSETNYTGGSWPGAVMSLVDGESDLYYYEVSVDAEYCLFNNGNGTQTSNQNIPTDDQTKYTYSADAWTALDVEPDTGATGTDYCIIGWIEGADSGTGGDYTDCDSYRFTVVDGTGSIDVTFTQDAYIGVKKADNSTWYWTSYSEEASCTFYSSGYDNKQKVPAGSWTITLIENGDGSVTMSYAASASYSLRSVRKLSTTADNTTGDVQLPDVYVYGDDEYALNLPAIKAQMTSDVVYGQYDEFVDDGESENVNVDINGASLVLSDDICMNYYVTVPENAENVYMTFQLNGETTVVTDYTVCEDGRYRFRFSGINAQKMGDDICATVYATVDGVQLTDCVEAYSVRAYCVSQLKKFADDEKLVRLISDLLVYGAKNQIYQGYKTDNLVTEGLTLSPSTFPGLDESENLLNVSGVADEAVRYSGVTLRLSSKVKLRLTVQTADPSAFTYKISTCGVDTIYTAEDLVKVSDGKYYLYFDGLKATGFDEVVTATILCDGQTVSQTVTYSVNSYIQKNQNADDQALRELVQAIYNYGCSADDYAG